jgi:uracil phosphoribosyltransferase
MPPKELAEFLGPVSPKKVEWMKSVGSDFDAYYGRALPPLSGTVNIHIGGWPHFERGAKDIRFVCLITVPPAIERLRGIHPDVRIWTAAIDERLDENAYIIPGLGDAGDRAFGTR